MDSSNQINVNGHISSASQMTSAANTPRPYPQQPFNSQPTHQQLANQQLQGIPNGSQGQNPAFIINYVHGLQGPFMPQQQQLGQTFGHPYPPASMPQQQQMRAIPPQPKPSESQQQQPHLHLRVGEQQARGFQQANPQQPKSPYEIIRQTSFGHGQNIRDFLRSQSSIPPQKKPEAVKTAAHHAVTALLSGLYGFPVELTAFACRPGSKPVVNTGNSVGTSHTGNLQYHPPSITPPQSQNGNSTPGSSAIHIDLTKDESAGKLQAPQNSTPTPISLSSPSASGNPSASSPAPVSAVPGSTKAAEVPSPPQIKLAWPKDIRTCSKVLNLGLRREYMRPHFYDAPDGVDKDGNKKTKEYVLVWDPISDTPNTMPVERYQEEQWQRQTKVDAWLQGRAQGTKSPAPKGPILCSNCQNPVNGSDRKGKPATDPQPPSSKPTKRAHEDDDSPAEPPTKKRVGRPPGFKNKPNRQYQKRTPAKTPLAPAAPAPPPQEQTSASTVDGRYIDPAILAAPRRAQPLEIDFGGPVHREDSSPPPADDEDELFAEVMALRKEQVGDQEEDGEDWDDEMDEFGEELVGGFEMGDGEQGVDDGQQGLESGGQAAELMDQRDAEQVLEENGEDILDEESEESEEE